MKRTITIVLIILTCLITSIVVFLFLTGMGADGAEKADTQGAIKSKEYKDSVSYSPSTSIITNIKNSNKYLRISFTLEIRDEKSKEYYKKNEYKIKDIIICVLRDKSEVELIAPDSQEYLKTSIREALATKINIENLIDIYIDEFVIQ